MGARIPLEIVPTMRLIMGYSRYWKKSTVDKAFQLLDWGIV